MLSDPHGFALPGMIGFGQPAAATGLNLLQQNPALGQLALLPQGTLDPVTLLALLQQQQLLQHHQQSQQSDALLWQQQAQGMTADKQPGVANAQQMQQ